MNRSYESIQPDADAAYSDEIDLDITGLEPQVALPHSPANAVAVGQAEGVEIDQVFIGSCTNGRITDLEAAAGILRGRKVHRHVRCIVIPGSQEVYGEALARGYLEASVHPGLDCIVVPKVESAEQVIQLSGLIDDLEQRRGIEPGRVKVSLIIESPRGILNLKEIAQSGLRCESMSIGPEDYCLKLGVEPSADGLELLFPLSAVITVCKAIGLRPYGLLGSVAGFRDLEGFSKAARRAKIIFDRARAIEKLEQRKAMALSGER